ncbi:hypothetical protein FF011L_13560 [Roseimaritima multifibrata]|uniref:Chromosome partition protein Smc n=1 Tax=Roseimaritima multifibrata TaxID=1930274 RepID=A0A517MCI8_9BACT|nr:hypothetical protein [Roseimaritima multifibrata]QDS92609.1 hypothetical protein FF011L_13560 [Roseimaritima multifibrata]
MTFLGKCFTFMIFILSAIFMALALAANASHRNWREEIVKEGGLKDQVEEFATKNRELEDARVRVERALAAEQVARRTALAALETDLAQKSDLLAKAEQALTSERATNESLARKDAQITDELTRLTADNAKLRQQIVTEQDDRDRLFARVLELTDKMNGIRGLLEVQKERNQTLVAQVTRFTEVMQARGINVNDALDGAPPARNGTVLVVDRGKKLVELSIGYDEGLRVGHMLEVTRGSQYLGRAKVRRTSPDRAVAEIMPDFTLGTIQKGDRVDTTIE